MSDDENIKLQRDRFVAFAFATADLFIEVSEDGKIIHVAGAAKTVTGIDQNALLNRNWLELFSAYEQAKMHRAREEARSGIRMGPSLVALNDRIGQRIGSFSAIKMPKSNRLYISLGVSNEFLAKIAPMVGLPGTNGFIDRDTYSDAARDAIFDAKLWGQDVVLSFFDFISAEDMQKRFGKEGWGKAEKMIGEILAQYSFGGYTAGQIADGRYSFVHDKSMSMDEVLKRIMEATRQQGLEINYAELWSSTISGDLQDISKKDLARAVDFTLTEFEKSGAQTKIDTMKKGYEAYMSANEQKVKQFKSIIERQAFIQMFQPIIDIKTRQALHYEILTRFDEGDTQEWVRFGEDAGLAPDFDLAVCDRALSYLKYKAGGTRTKFSVDISAQSICDAKFFEKLNELLAKHKGVSDRLSFEITESANIEDLQKASLHVKELQKEGFKVALDDFHPSAAAAQYLQFIKADFIKIDGRYIRRMNSSPREAALIQNLVTMCQNSGTEVIAESVEQKDQEDALNNMGIKYAQGFLYAQLSQKPDYVPKA